MALKILVSDTNTTHGNSMKANILSFSSGSTVDVYISSFGQSVTYAISNGYNGICRATTGLSDYRIETAGLEAKNAGIFVVHAHNGNTNIFVANPSYISNIIPPRGTITSYGPGLEFTVDVLTESDATSYVTGMICKLLDNHPNWSYDDVRQALRESCDTYDNGWNSSVGFGIVDIDVADTISTPEPINSINSIDVVESTETYISMSWKSFSTSSVDFIVSIFNEQPALTATPSDGTIVYEGANSHSQYDHSIHFEATRYVGFYLSGSASRLESYSSMSVYLSGSDYSLSIPAEPPTVHINTDTGWLEITDITGSSITRFTSSLTTPNYIMGAVQIGTTGSSGLVSGSLHVWNNISASSFIGDGSNITGVISASYSDTSISSSFAENTLIAESASSVPVGAGSYWTASVGEISRKSDVKISGSFYVSSSLVVVTATADYFVGDASGLTGTPSSSYASFATSCSFAESASYEIIKEVSSSHADYATSASHAELSDSTTSASYSDTSISSSFAENALSASAAEFTVTSSYAEFATSASSAEWASVATSASHAGFATSASATEFTVTSSYAEFATSASHAEFADIAISASSVPIGAGSYWTSSNGLISRNGDVQVLGSTTFGDSADDNHQFTGSIRQSGSKSYFMNNVGIGLDDPSTKLDVSGSTKFGVLNGTHQFTGSIYQNIYQAGGHIDEGIRINDSTGFFFMGQGTNDANTFSPIIKGKPYGAGKAFFIRGIQNPDASTMETFRFSAANDTENGAIAAGEKAFTFYNWTTNLITILGDGKVGIGKTNPSTKLQVYGTASIMEGAVGIGTTNPDQALHIEGSDSTFVLVESTANSAAYLLKRPNNTKGGTINFYTSTTTDWLIGLRATTDSDFHIYSYGTATDVMVIKRATGNVGIGTTDPQAELHVVGEISASSISASGDVHVGGHIFADCCYGEMFISASTTETVIGSANTWYQVDNFEGGLTGSSIHYSGSTLENDHTGIFVLEWQASVAAATINDIFQVGVSINNAIPEVKTIIERKFSNNDIGALSGRAFLALTTGDLVTLKVFNVDGTGNITAKFANVGYRRM